MAGRTVRTLFEFVSTARTGGVQDTRDEIERLDRALDDTAASAGGVSQESSRAEGALSGLGQAAKVAGLALGGMAVGAAVGATGQLLKDVTELSGAMSRFEAQTGLTGEALEEVKASAQKLFAEGFGDGFDDVTLAMQQAMTITGHHGRALEEVTRRALIFSDAFDTNITESVRAADTMAENFGGNASQMLDVLMTGFHRTGDPAGDLLDTFNEYSANFSGLGLDAADMLSILETGLAAGARNTDDIADGVREFGIRLRDGTSDLAIWKLGLDGMKQEFLDGEVSGEAFFNAVIEGLRDIEDPMERNRIGVEMFGTKWEDVGEDVFLALETAEEGIADMAGATTDAGRALQRGLGPAWERFQRKVRVGLMTAIEPLIEKGLNALVGALEDLSTWIDTVGLPLLNQFIGILDGMGVNAETVGGAFSWLVDVVSGLSPESVAALGAALAFMAGPSIISGLAGVASGIGGMASKLTSVAANPALLIAIAGIAAYETNFADFKTNMDNFVGALKEGDLSGAGDALKEQIIDLAAEVGGLLGIDVNAGLGAWEGIFENLKIIVYWLWQRTKNFVETVIDLVVPDSWESLKNTFTIIKNVLGFLVNRAAAFISDLTGFDVPEAWETLKSVFTIIKNVLGLIANRITEFVENLLGIEVPMPLQLIAGLFNSIKSAITWVRDNASDILGGIDFPIPQVLKDMAGLVTGIVDGLRQIGNSDAGGGGEYGMGGAEVHLGAEYQNGYYTGATALRVRQDSGGRGQAGQVAVIGTGAQPELFVPDTPGTFYPRGQYALAGGGVSITGGEFHFHGVQDVGAMYEQLERVARQRAQGRRGR